ncbi:MAG: DNA replication/repair protein RecF [Hellea sp.]|nr:DNA replication/repair protein RecF [Hellea sp.]
MTARHYISHLRLTDFRNYSALDLELSGAPVVLFGPNGAGKTNLLEAISLLSPGRGLRRSKLEVLARKDGETQALAWGVNAQLLSGDDDYKLAIGQLPETPGRRVVRLDGKSVSAADLAAHVTMFWLTPDQDPLFRGPASDRRKFLDRFTLMQSPDHGGHIVAYEKLRSERNRLLGEGIEDYIWYEALETDMADFSTRIAYARAETVNRLMDEIDRRDEGAFPKARIALEGEMEEQIQSGIDPDAVRVGQRAMWADTRRADLRAGRTLRGVHRSDLKVTHREKDMPAEHCSTGEQKALLIGLMLAQARAQADKNPFLLLDEVAAHLDEHRRAALIEELIELGTQVIMTGTDASLFEAFDGRAELFEVRDGAITA